MFFIYIYVYIYIYIYILYNLLITLLIFLITSNAVSLRRDKSILFSRIVIKALLFASFIAVNNLYMKPLEGGIGIYGGLFFVNGFTHAFDIFVFLISSFILILTAFYPRKVYVKQLSSFYNLLSSKFSYNKDLIANKTGEQFRIIEYALIIVFILCGAVFLISTGDLISLFLSIELQSYGLYIISTLYRDSESATASGLTYFLLGGLSSCFILLGSSLIYANSGITSFHNIYALYAVNECIFSFINQDYMDLAFIIMLVGFLFKVSAAPFHFWSPDVYDGVPTIVTTYIAIIAKISIFALFLELSVNMVAFDNSWHNIFVMSSFLSLIVGSVLGLTQFRIKRLLAYSTISHVGFILLALFINTAESRQSCIFYILQYTIANLNAFFIVLSIGFSLYIYTYKTQTKKNKENLVDENNSPIQLINQMKGYFYVNPFISLSFAITIFSFIGIPPIAGFFAKQMILSAAIDNNDLFITFVAILTSVIGAGYYLYLIKTVFFVKQDYEINPSISDINLTGYITKSSVTTNKQDSSLDSNKFNESLAQSSQKTEPILFKADAISINSGLSSTISLITLLLLLFIYIPGEWFNIVSILTIVIS